MAAQAPTPVLVISVSWSPILQLSDRLTSDPAIAIRPRDSDWGLHGWRKRLHHVTSAIRVLRNARHAQVLVVCNAAIDMLVIAGLRWLIAPRLKLVAVDFLTPAPRRGNRALLRLLSRFDRVLCIRSADMDTLHRVCAVPLDRLAFIPFPADPRLLSVPTEDDGSIYSGGFAHRDWPTFISAIELLPTPSGPVHLSSAAAVSVPPAMADRITLLGALSPDDAREFVRRARVVAIVNEPTVLPHGPLVLLDALALGKAVVATRTSGVIDYVTDGVNGMLVEPQDPAALARALTKVLGDRALREGLEREARRSCRESFTADRFATTLLSHIEELGIELR
ncbi:MAG: glycosyltransferase family 4 protein [Acidimicrobiales bacterium]|jgi:glycosyltransferase involved in cell wall biosynthesis|nr:glycosyltransferase family 4 protein [Acidimicrobiales bacterium]